jgi:hypothetical protein
VYFVRKAFKNSGYVYLVGSVITDPTIIKRFKHRLNEKYVVDVNEQNIETMTAYFKDKIGVDISKPIAPVSLYPNIAATVKVAADNAPKEIETPVVTPEVIPEVISTVVPEVIPTVTPEVIVPKVAQVILKG